MKNKWLIRLPVQFVTGGAALAIAWQSVPANTAGSADFKLAGTILTTLSGVLVLVDLFWGLASRKLDESFGSGSVLTAREKDRWRRAAFQAERDLLFTLVVTVLLKAVVLTIGAGLLGGLFPPASCRWLALTAFAVLGFALPTVLLMPTAYLSARQARLELAAYEEEQAERAKALQELGAAPAHDFQSDPQYASFGRIITPKG